MRTSVFFTFLLFSPFSFAQTTDENAVHSLIENLYETVYTQLDETKIPDYFTSDFSGFADGREINTDSVYLIVHRLKETFQSEQNRNLNLTRKNKIEFKTIEVLGNRIRTVYKNTAKYTLNGTAILTREWMESAELIQTPEGLRIKNLITSPFSNSIDRGSIEIRE